jgi:glycosyltransferase involved in cell wall biosynthesis
MKIAIFDHVIAPHSGPGGCDVEVLRALHDEHQVTVFASELVLPADGGNSVTHVAVPTVRHPALASFLIYLARACVSYELLRARGARFDVVQATDCSFPVADVCYAHLCHRAFLTEVWPGLRPRMTPRSVHSWLGHKARALIEARLVRAARVIVVPSEGLRRDFARLYPGAAPRITVIRNSVDLAHYAPPRGFDRRSVRARMETEESQTAFVFVALGHFERKGLPLLLEALTVDRPELQNARLWVVGGEPGLVATYRGIAEQLGVAGRVAFAGRTDDVRPFLWSADAFVSPSHYEAFSLALLEAAAAGLPLIVTRISGSEELLQEGINGFELERTPTSIAAGVCRFLSLDASRREAMRHAVRQSVEPLRPERFSAAWQALYGSLAG